MAQRIKELELALNDAKDTKAAEGLHYLLLAALAIIVFFLGFSIGKWNGPLDHANRVSPPNGELRTFDVVERAFADSNYSLAMKLALPFAESGVARAQVIVGEIFYHDRESLRDDAQAMKWFQMAAKQSDPIAQLHLGEMYFQGHGAPQDYTEAARWYRLAAEQGNARAQYNLGLAYSKGDGVPRNMAQAYTWFNIAASRFHASASSDRALAVKNRDIAANRLSQACLLEAQKRSREWQPTSNSGPGEVLTSPTCP